MVVKVKVLTPFAKTHEGLNVQGAVTASRIALKDSNSAGSETVVDTSEFDPDFVYVATSADVSSIGFVETHEVGFYRQEGSEQDPDNIVLSDIFTVRLGVRDFEDGSINKGVVNIQVAGTSSNLGVKASLEALPRVSP